VSPDLNAHPVFDAGILHGLHLLEADAGTGKTWTIAGLVVRALIERELGLEQLLVVTFTNAATAELGARIRQRIAELERRLDDRLEGRAPTVFEPFCVACDARLDDAAARRARSALRVALARVDEMAVHTIHGYCQRVIDEHAMSIGVPAGLRASADAVDPRLDRLSDWWREQAREASPARLLAFGLAGLTPDVLRDAVRAISAQPLARVEPAAGDWRRVEVELAEVRRSLADALEREGDALLDWVGVRDNVDGRRMRVDWARGWLDALRGFCLDPHATAVPEQVSRLASERFGGRLPPSAIPGHCDRLLQVAAAIERLPAWIAQELAAECAASREADLARARSLGFDDLLRAVHDALADPVAGAQLARALRERHPMALIDECQDTDALQWAIFRRIYVEADTAPERAGRAVEPALVLVGDPKQAIYAFRGADVYSYLGAREAVGRIHRLDENQRSGPGLIAAVNALYRRDRPFLVEDIAFAGSRVGARPRRAFGIDDSPQRAPMTVVRLEPDPQTGWLNAGAARRQAIDACVSEIGRLLRSGARLDDAALRPADIAVLVNTHWQGAAIKRALAASGIGAAEVSRDSVLETLECAELMRVLAAIAEPGEPGLMRSALATTLVGGTADGLLALDRDAQRALSSSASFARAGDDWLRHGPIAALRRLIREAGVGARLAAVRDGDRRLTNLMHLVELLGDDDEARRGPQQALRALARRRAADVARDRDSEELRLESDEDLVRILTVHKSKGLEFPVVFLPFAWSAKPAAAPLPRVRHEREAGAGWRAVLDFAPTAQAARQSATEWHAEALRTMYVALTRAEQRCYLFWGAAAGAQYSPLAWLLAGLDPVAQQDWRAGQKGTPPLGPDAIDHALDAWKARAAASGTTALAVVDTPTLVAALQRGRAGAGSSDSRDSRDSLAEAAAGTDGTPDDSRVSAGTAPLGVRPWRTVIAAPSIATSFSAMANAASRDDPGGAIAAQDAVDRPDHDQQPLPPEPAPAGGSAADAAPALEAAIRFRFPSGTQAGVCLHGVLEEARFDLPFDRRAVADRLARGGYRRIDAGQVAEWLEQVVATPMRAPRGEIVRLAEVPSHRQVRELDFLMAGAGVSDRAIVEAVDAEFGLDVVAGGSRWSGFLRGFIDLVFEHGGRYYLLDWKSNHLGDTVRHYAADALATAMRRHAYPLQASLYTLALHRWLRRRLPAYDYDSDFGGVFYVFLRGAGLPAPSGGTAAGHAAGGDAAGVHASRPSRALIDRLDRLFATAPRSEGG